MWQSLETLNVFNTITLKQIFFKTKTFLKRQDYCFLVESIKIEIATFPYKITLSEHNVKTIELGVNRTERSFASNYFIFWKFCFSLKIF